MTNERAWNKRIRRRILAPNREFFAATAPGLEKVFLNEFVSFDRWNVSPGIVKGGVEFSGKVPIVYEANLLSRTAVRIMMRIGEFRASNFRQLEKKLSKVPWELYTHPHHTVRVKVSSSHSRLYHTGAVGARIGEIINNVPSLLQTSAVTSQPVIQTVYVRIVDDRVTLSLDSSGEILYKRGIKTHRARAPLRETTAAAALLIAGYDRDEPLIDPMCGSGTFSLEAAMMALNIPPGWFREFAFMQWPCFNPARWKFIRSRYERQMLKLNKPVIFASDIDSRICRDLKHCIEKNRFGDIVTVSDGLDFFSFCPEHVTKKTGLVVLNPPYGLRMDFPDQQTDWFFREIFKKLKTDYKRWRVAMILPKQHLVKSMPQPLNMQPLFHGGLRLFLVYGTIS